MHYYTCIIAQSHLRDGLTRIKGGCVRITTRACRRGSCFATAHAQTWATFSAQNCPLQTVTSDLPQRISTEQSSSLLQVSSRAPHTFFLFFEESSVKLLFLCLSPAAAVTSSSSSSGIRLYLVPPGCMKHSLAKWPAKQCLKLQPLLPHAFFVRLHFRHLKCQQPPYYWSP